MKISIPAFVIGLALTLLLAPLSLKVQEINITLQTFILFTVAASLGKRTGALVALVYLLLGALGLPVFAGHQLGFQKLIGPTAGFLWAFPVCCYLIGSMVERGRKDFFHIILYFFITHLILLIPGFVVLKIMLPGTKVWETLVLLGPGLIAKSIGGGLLSSWLIKKLPPSWTEVS